MDVVICLLLFALITNGVHCINGGQPPVITTRPSPQIAYKEFESVDLPCDADGFPKPQFFWEKNGIQVNLTDEFVQDKNSGKLTIKRITAASHDGIYQCFAYNEYGVAVTTKTVLKRAELHTFPTALPKTHYPHVGDKLTLNCSPPASYPAANIYWGKIVTGSRLQPIENTERISLDYAGNLYFSNVAKEDYVVENQMYICIAEQDVLRTLTQGNDCVLHQPENDTATPTYQLPARMWSSKTTHVAIRGQDAKMKCIFSGYPTPTVTWTRVNSRLPSKVILQSFGQEIVIPKVNVSDAGIYKCTANNSATGPFISYNFSLIVEAAPYWRNDLPPQNIIAAEDDDVEFQCNADGVPNPTIVWTVNGRPLSEAEPNSRRILSGSSLKFRRVQKNDSQVFQCVASNVHGSALANAYLFVRAEKPSVLESLPKLTKVPEGKTVALMCRMDGAPKPVITWHRGHDRRPVSGDRVRILSNGDLEIADPKINDSDVYYCVGKNKFDEETAHGELIVRQKTLITQPPQSQNVNVSERVEFACKADTDPEEQSNLEVAWYKDDQPLNRTDVSVVVTSDKLVIDSVRVSDTGTYKCRADNKVDAGEAVAQLIVKDRPNPPTDVHITSCLSGSAELSWTASEDNNDPILDYVVYYNTSYDPADGYHVAKTVKRTSAKIQPLTPWTDYSFHVTARNGLGTSDRSAFTLGKCSTSQVKPHKSPSGVCTRNGNPGELVITWKPMPRSEHHGEGFRYLVRYQLASDADSGIGENMSEEVRGKNELIVKNQEIYKRYRISVLAVNNIGAAPDRMSSVHYGFSSEGVPSVKPENFGYDKESLSSTSVTFSWDPVDESPESINGNFLGYRVLFWRAKYPDEFRTEDKIINEPTNVCPRDNFRRRRSRNRRSSERVTVTTHKLWGGASIVAAAVVLNGASAGDRSNPIEFDTPEGVPGVVSSLEIAERGSHHLKVEWTAPLEINGVLRGFQVGYTDAGGTMKMFYVDALQSEAKVHDLLPNSTYLIFVEAHTSVGPGVRRYVSGTTLPVSGLPDVPDIEEPELGENFAVIKWKPSVHPHPENPGSSFHVEYQIKDSDELSRSEVEKQHNWINLTDLDSNKRYRVMVVASNAVGNSSRSEPKEFVLGESNEPVLHSAELSGWLIGLILVILLLLLLILIILCCIRRCRQGKYAVYEKEKLHGCNIDSGNEEPTFGEYVKSNAPTLQAPHDGSVDSIEKPLESDSNSLAEYEETDPTKFNEDGSFIGQYGGQRKEGALDQNAPFATLV